MFHAYIVKTPRGHFAHKILCDTASEGERQIRGHYNDLQSIEHVGSSEGSSQDLNAHALYDKALALSRKREEAENLF
jgi:hypothetical protein